MRSTAKAILFFGVIVCGPGFSAEPAPRRTADEYVKAIDALKAADPAPEKSSLCEAGYVLNAHGHCGAATATEGADLYPVPPEGARGHLSAARTEIRVASISHKPRFVRPPVSSALSDLMITFKTGSAEIDESGRSEAREFAAALSRPAELDTRFEIAGHTDASGSADRNRILSEARAEAVKGFLVSQGVEAARLEAKGYGAEDLARPSAPFDKANRRVEARPLK